MRIISAMLREQEACPDQVRVFDAEWPNGVTVTLEALERAVELNLNLDWAAENLLSAQALAAYEQATAPARAAYEQEAASAREAYKQEAAQALAAYEQEAAPARAAYYQAKAEAFYAACESRSLLCRLRNYYWGG